MHRTKSLATIVCSAVLMGGGVLGAAGTASASGLDCGTPAAPAVHTTVAHPAVPAVTNIDTVIDVAARAAVTHTEAQWQRAVVDTPAQPAIEEQSHQEFGFTPSDTVGPWGDEDNQGWLTGQSFSHDAQGEWDYSSYRATAPDDGREWVQTHGVQTVVDKEAWNTLEFGYFADVPANSDDPSIGEWTPTGHTRTVMDRPAYDDPDTVVQRSQWERKVPQSHLEFQYGHDVPAVTHTEWVWTKQVVDQPATEGSPATYRTETSWAEATPSGDGWAPTGQTQTTTVQDAYDEVVGTTWSAQSPGAGWTDAGESRVAAGGYAYVDKHGRIKYESSPDWNGGGDTGHDSGWNRAAGQDKVEHLYQQVVHHDAVTRTEHEYSRQVVDTPAVPPTEATYTPIYSGYQADSPGEGWTRTDDSREVTDQVGHTETRWVTDRADAPAGWSYLGQRTVQDEPKVEQVWTDDAEDGSTVRPAGYGWSLVGSDIRTVEGEHHPAVTHLETQYKRVHHHPAQTHQIWKWKTWVVTQEAYTDYGWMRVVVDVPAQDAAAEVSHLESTWLPEGATPEGDGWSLTGETREVTDEPAVAEQSHTEKSVVTPAVAAWDEQVLVSEAVPAGQDCPAAPTGSDPSDGTAPPAVGVHTPAAPVSEPAQDAVLTADPVVAHVPVAAPAPAAASPAAAPSSARSDGDHQLAFTGADSATIAAGGFLMTLLGGLMLLLRPRSRRSE